MKTWEQRLRILTALLQLLSTTKCLETAENVAERSFFSRSPSNDNLYSFRYDLIDEADGKGRPLESNPFHEIYSLKGKDGEIQRVHYAADDKGLRANFHSNAFQVQQNYVPAAPETPLLWPIGPNAEQPTYISSNPLSLPYISLPGQISNLGSQSNVKNSNLQNTLGWMNSLIPLENTGIQHTKSDKDKMYNSKLSLSSKKEVPRPISEDLIEPHQPLFLNYYGQTNTAANDVRKKKTAPVENIRLSKKEPVIRLQSSSLIKPSENPNPQMLYENTIGDILRVAQAEEIPAQKIGKTLKIVKLSEKSLDHPPLTKVTVVPISANTVNNQDKISNLPLNREDSKISNDIPKSILKKVTKTIAASPLIEKSMLSKENTEGRVPQAKKPVLPSSYQNLKLTAKEKKLLSNMEKLQGKTLSPMSTVFDISTNNGRYYHYILNMGSSKDKKSVGKNKYFSTGDALLKLLNEAGIPYKNEDLKLFKGQSIQKAYEKTNNIAVNTSNIRRKDSELTTTTAPEYSYKSNETQYPTYPIMTVAKVEAEANTKLKESKNMTNESLDNSEDSLKATDPNRKLNESKNITNQSVDNSEDSLKATEPNSEHLLSTTEHPSNVEVETTTSTSLFKMNNEDEINSTGISKSAGNLTEIRPLLITMPEYPLNMLLIPVSALLTPLSPEENQTLDKTEMSTNLPLTSTEAFATTEIMKELNETTTTSLPEILQFNQHDIENSDNDTLFTHVPASTLAPTTVEDLVTSVSITTVSEQENTIVFTESSTVSTPAEVTMPATTVTPIISNFSFGENEEDTLESPFTEEQDINTTNAQLDNSNSSLNIKNISESAKEITKSINSTNNGKFSNVTNPVTVIEVSNMNDLMSYVIDFTPELVTLFRNQSSESSVDSGENAKEYIQNNSQATIASDKIENVDETTSTARENSSLSAQIVFQKSSQPVETEKISNLFKTEKNTKINETDKNTTFPTPSVFKNELFKQPPKNPKTSNGVIKDNFEIIEVDIPQSEYSLIHPLLLENDIKSFLQISPNGMYSILEIPSALASQYQQPANLQSEFVEYLLRKRDTTLPQKNALGNSVAPNKPQYSLVNPELSRNFNGGSKLLPVTEEHFFDNSEKQDDMLHPNELPISFDNANELEYTLLRPETSYNDNNIGDILSVQNEMPPHSANANELQYTVVRAESVKNPKDGNKVLPSLHGPNYSDDKLQFQNQEYYLVNDMIEHLPYQANATDAAFVPIQSDIHFIPVDGNPEYQQLSILSPEYSRLPAESQRVEQILTDSFKEKVNMQDSIDLSYGNAFTDILRLNMSNNQNPPVDIVEYVPVESTRNNKAVNFIPGDSNNYLQEPVVIFEEYTEVPDYRQSNIKGIGVEGTRIPNNYIPASYPNEENFQILKESSPVFGDRIQEVIRGDYIDEKYLPQSPENFILV